MEVMKGCIRLNAHCTARQSTNLAPPSKTREEKHFLPSLLQTFGIGFLLPGSKREGRKCFYYFTVARLELCCKGGLMNPLFV